MSTEAARRLLYMLQIANASFPTGAFNHSYGFETWIDSEEIRDAATFETACRDWLMYGVASADGAAVAHAHRAAAKRDTDALVRLDILLGALKLTRETRGASRKMGHALLRTLGAVFEPPGLALFADAIHAGRCEGHSAVIFGAAARDLGLSEQNTVLAFLQSSLANLAGVAARLVPLGQMETQRVLKRATPLLVKAASRARSTELDMMGTATAALDVASMRHERLHTRLCMS